mmetsp:Transcript_50376/g.156017  ORF Transcript_50376/g.156017 Transcript_50376/m.156017 type:complete len:216 (-) Transcript_50376:8-655(-)
MRAGHRHRAERQQARAPARLREPCPATAAPQLGQGPQVLCVEGVGANPWNGQGQRSECKRLVLDLLAAANDTTLGIRAHHYSTTQAFLQHWAHARRSPAIPFGEPQGASRCLTVESRQQVLGNPGSSRVWLQLAPHESAGSRGTPECSDTPPGCRGRRRRSAHEVRGQRARGWCPGREVGPGKGCAATMASQHPCHNGGRARTLEARGHRQRAQT